MKNTSLFTGLMLVLIVAYSCKKDDVRNTTAQIMIMNASPNSGSLELLQNLKSVGEFNYLTGFNPTVGYTTLDSGFNNYKLKKGGAEIAGWLFANTGLRLSFYITDTATTSRIKYFFLTDNLDTTGLGNRSKIRFVHLSPDIDTVDVLTSQPSNLAQDSAIISSKIYAGKFTQPQNLNSGTFQNFYADSLVYIKIRQRSNNSIAKQYQFNFKKGGVYSLLLKGYVTRNGADSLSLSIIQHN